MHMFGNTRATHDTLMSSLSHTISCPPERLLKYLRNVLRQRLIPEWFLSAIDIWSCNGKPADVKMAKIELSYFVTALNL